MSTLPPPTPPSPPVAPVTAAAAAAPARQKPSTTTIGLLAAVAVVAAGGTFLATRGDDAATVAPATTTTVAVTVAPSTMAPVIVEPSTTVGSAPESTTPATVVIPDGATELGYGVYVPAADGLEVTGDDPYTFSSDASGNRTSLQVLARDPGEDPNAVIQEYIDTWDADYDLVAYAPSVLRDPGYKGHEALRYTSVTYSVFSSDPAQENTTGVVFAIVRTDGLTVVGDLYGPQSDLSPTPYDSDTLAQSLADAPPVDDAGEWYPAVSMTPTSSHHQVVPPFAPAARITLPDDFDITTQNSNSIECSNGVQTVAAWRLDGVVDISQAVDGALAAINTTRATTAVGELSGPTGDNAGYLPLYVIDWSGTETDGSAATGRIRIVLDESTQRTVVVLVTRTDGEWDGNLEAILQWGLRGLMRID
ncbi:MAG: hypothetical protein ABMA25_22235 [Ilumatobacteraceae bacterium]